MAASTNVLQTVNSFTKGMNFDLDESIVPSNSYRDCVNGNIVTSSTGASMALQPFYGFDDKSTFVSTIVNEYDEVVSSFPENEEFIHVNTYRSNYIVFTNSSVDSKFRIYRATTSSSVKWSYKCILAIPQNIMWVGTYISSVIRYESDDNIKLYWSDGINPIRIINIATKYDDENIALQDDSSINIIPSVLHRMPDFKGFSSGSLLCGKYQYGYILYNKYGSQTTISPLTGGINIFPSGYLNVENSSKIHGDASNVTSGKSVKLNITVDTQFDTLKLVRIYYADNSNIPDIKIVADVDLNGKTQIDVEDTGSIVLSELTIEEFKLLSLIDIVPSSIETKNNYLFAANLVENIFDVTYDARSYRASNKGYIRLNSVSGDTTIETHINNVLNGSKIVPETHDCVNSYNDMSKSAFDFIKHDTYSSNDPLADTYKYAYKHTNDTKNVFGGSGINVDYEFVQSELIGDSDDPENLIDYIKKPGDVDYTGADMVKDVSTRYITGNQWISKADSLSSKPVNFKSVRVIEQNGSIYNKEYYKSSIYTIADYSNPIIDYDLKSLHRDELYSYGIEFFNNKGQVSPTKWIADIRTPNIQDILSEDIFSTTNLSSIYDDVTDKSALLKYVGGFRHFATNAWSQWGYSQLITRPLGIKFTIKNIPTEAVAYRIVRAERNISNKSILSQGFTTQLFPSSSTTNLYYPSITTTSAIRPLPLVHYNGLPSPMSTGNFYTSREYGTLQGKALNNIYQFVSPDTCYSLDAFGDAVSQKSMKISIADQLIPIHQFDAYKTVVFQSNVDTVDGELSIGEYGKPDIGDGVLEPSYELKYNLWREYNLDQTVINGVKYNISNVSKYYNSLFGSTSNGKNTDNIKTVVKSKDITWENWLKRNEYAISIGGKSIVNGVVTTTNDKDAKWAKCGPTSPSLYIEFEDTGSVNPLDGFYGDSLVTCTQFGNKFINTKKTRRSDKTFVNDVNSLYYMDFVGYYSSNPVENTHWVHYPMSIRLVNLRNVEPVYGGQSYSARQNRTYTAFGHYKIVSNYTSETEYVFKGDTYISLFNTKRIHQKFEKDPGNNTDYDDYKKAVMSLDYVIPVETSLNLNLVNGDTFIKERSAQSQVAPGNINNVYTQDKPMYVYNSAYSAQQFVEDNLEKNKNDDLTNNYDTRIYHSEMKINGELIDSWTMFKSNNFIEIDSRYGSIESLYVFKNQLLAFQKRGVATVAVNERSLIEDGNNAKLALGTGGILERYDYLSTFVGFEKTDRNSIVESDTSLYFYDRPNNMIISYNGQFQQLSKSKMIQNYLDNNKPTNSVKAVYDRITNNVLFSIKKKALETVSQLDKNILVYSEQLDAFSTFLTTPFTFGLNPHGGKLQLFANKNSTISIDVAKDLYIKLLSSVINSRSLTMNTYYNIYVKNHGNAMRLFSGVYYELYDNHNNLHPYNSPKMGVYNVTVNSQPYTKYTTSVNEDTFQLNPSLNYIYNTKNIKLIYGSGGVINVSRTDSNNLPIYTSGSGILHNTSVPSIVTGTEYGITNIITLNGSDKTESHATTISTPSTNKYLDIKIKVKIVSDNVSDLSFSNTDSLFEISNITGYWQRSELVNGVNAYTDAKYIINLTDSQCTTRTNTFTNNGELFIEAYRRILLDSSRTDVNLYKVAELKATGYRLFGGFFGTQAYTSVVPVSFEFETIDEIANNNDVLLNYLPTFTPDALGSINLNYSTVEGFVECVYDYSTQVDVEDTILFKLKTYNNSETLPFTFNYAKSGSPVSKSDTINLFGESTIKISSDTITSQSSPLNITSIAMGIISNKSTSLTAVDEDKLVYEGNVLNTNSVPVIQTIGSVINYNKFNIHPILGNIKSKMSYVVNENYDYTKVFDNVEFNGSYLTTLNAIPDTDVVYVINGINSKVLTESEIEDRESTYMYAIPREDTNDDIPSRLRGKSTKCTFTINEGNMYYKIPYFKTKYRMSKI